MSPVWTWLRWHISVDMFICLVFFCYWHCQHSMRQGLCNGTVSICLSHLLTIAAACGTFAAVGPAGRRHRSTSMAAGRPTPQHTTAWCSLANVISVTFLADVGSGTDTCYFSLWLHLLLLCLSSANTTEESLTGLFSDYGRVVAFTFFKWVLFFTDEH